VRYAYYDDKPKNAHAASGYSGWTVAMIDDFRGRARRREPQYYGMADVWLYDALDKFPVQGKDVAVFGAVLPWYEALLLERGAKSVTTIEYNVITLQYPGHHALLAPAYWADPARPTFDAVVSISSFEHDGLGRYGDPLDPFGDLHVMARLARALRPGGVAYVAVPANAETDILIFNAARVYGPVRMPLLLAGWDVLAQFGQPARHYPDEAQPVYVLRPAAPPAA
jgi:SAM-dependent methyltransferase